jgi:Methyltransferase domain
MSPRTDELICPICLSQTRKAHQATILNKHSSFIWTCPACDFSHFDPVFWLDEAYAEAINVSDVGYIYRNNASCQLVSSLLCDNYAPEDLFLDFGAGYGMFVRLMRDRGFRFQYYDPTCNNLFARFNEANLEGGRLYKLATAMEVIEHTIDPVAMISEILEHASAILLSTEIAPTAPPDLAWWYLGLEHGQHISFFGPRTFGALAARLSLRYTRLYSNWHLLSNGALNLGNRTSSRIGRVLNCLRLRKTHSAQCSLMMPDFATTRLFLQNPDLAAQFHFSIDEYDCSAKLETGQPA